MFAIISSILKLFGIGAQMAQENKHKAEGAALQRGLAAEDELERFTRAASDRRKAQERVNDEKFIQSDSNNRDNAAA